MSQLSFPTVFLSKSRTRGRKLNRRSRRRNGLRAPIQGVQALALAEDVYLPSSYVVNAAAPDLVPTKATTPFGPVAKSVGNSLIFWLGEDYDDLFDKGSAYGFNCQWLDGSDLSSLKHAKCLVVCCADTIDKVFSFVNFACEYGIPSIWLNRTLPPEVCYWSFSSRLHVNDSAFFWGDLCQLIE